MLCQNCGKHEATTKWLGQGSALDFVHGNYWEWCECCALREQLAYAKKLAEGIPELEAKLAMACREVIERGCRACG